MMSHASPGLERRARPSGTARGLWSIAAAGNCTALAVLALVLINAEPLFELERRPAMEGHQVLSGPRVGPPASKLLLVVIDALRLDTARDATVMPRLARLAERGGHGIAVVDSLIPSTVAGIRAMVTGSVPAPASFFQDFGASRSRQGGLFAAVKRRGGRSFVTGTHLWTDLYGEWIDEAEIVRTLAADDERVLEAGRRALESGRFELVVVHFQRCDELAHRYGALSPEYRAGARWCDGAVGALLRGAPPDLAVIVTSDHGVTGSGGHAGPERAVRRVPLAVAGPGLPKGRFEDLPQSAIGSAAGRALGLPAGPKGDRAPCRPPRPGWTAFLVLGALVCVTALRFFCRMGSAAALRWQSTWLDAALWSSLLGALALELTTGAFAIALGSLACVAFLPSRDLECRLRAFPALAFLAGCALGAARMADAWFALDGPTGAVEAGPRYPCLALAAGLPLVCTALWRRRVSARGIPRPVPRRRGAGTAALLLVAAALLGSVPLLTVVALGLISGRLLGEAVRWSPAASSLAGVGLVGMTALLGAASGETASLSSLDVHVVFDLVDGRLGLPGAIAVALLRYALPALGLLAGALPVARAGAPQAMSRFLAAAGAALLGEAFVASACLVSSAGSPVGGALAVGALVRTLAETNFVFLSAALLLIAWAFGRWTRQRLRPAPQ